MRIPELDLDTLTWADLVDLGRRAVPAASDGVWTLHAPVDPGITLLELFAAELEQRLFMLDRVPDTLTRAICTVLTGAGPRPARAATTVLSLDGSDEVPVGAELTNLDTATVLTTLTAVHPVPVTTVDGGSGLVFGPGGRTPAVLHVVAAAAAEEHVWFFDLAAADDDVVPPPPELRPVWESSAGTGRWPLTVEDETAGLRKPGLVRLRRADGHRLPRAFDVTIARPPGGGPAWPRLTGIAPNAVRAAQRRRVESPAIDVGDGLAIPSRVVPLTRGLLDDPALFGIVAHRPDGTEEPWTVVGDIALSGPGDRHVQADRATGRLTFGDGRSGRIPRWPAGTRLCVTYWVGGGPSPEIMPGTVFEGDGCAGRTVTRPAGGAEPEAAAAARSRVTAELVRPARAATVADIRAIIEALPGVALAAVHVEPGWDPDLPGHPVPDAAGIFCLPLAGERDDAGIAAVPAPELDEWTRVTVARALEAARLIGYRFTVRGPAYRKIAVTARIDVHVRDRAAARRRVATALRRHLDPLVGGSDGGGWPFGAAVGPPDLTVVAQRALGVQGEVTALAIGDTDCEPLALRPYELPAVDSVTVTGPGRSG